MQKKHASMLGKWDGWYKNITHQGSFRYGNTITYRLAGDFLQDCTTLEDWGCGTGGFRSFYHGHYLGLDGSANPFVDQVVDLCEYRSSPEAIFIRHVLEHNYDWPILLDNALASFQKKLCLVIFTPFSPQNTILAQNKKHGVDVPDISFQQKGLEKHFKGLKWKMETHKTRTGYGQEHIYFIEK